MRPPGRPSLRYAPSSPPLVDGRLSALLQEALPRDKQGRIDGQHEFVRKPMLEHQRRQRGATRENNVRAVLRFDAANAFDNVRSEALERSPFETFPAVGSDIFRCRIE